MDILNKILAALSVGLDALYPNIPVYSEDVPQKVPPRCFLIGFAGAVTMQTELSGRVRVSGSLEITYLAPEQSTDTKRELNQVYTTLALGLPYIEHGGIDLHLRSHSRKDDGSDGALKDVCSFATFLTRVDDTPQMGTIDSKEAVKYGEERQGFAQV